MLLQALVTCDGQRWLQINYGCCRGKWATRLDTHTQLKGMFKYPHIGPHIMTQGVQLCVCVGGGDAVTERCIVSLDMGHSPHSPQTAKPACPSPSGAPPLYNHAEKSSSRRAATVKAIVVYSCRQTEGCLVICTAPSHMLRGSLEK